MFLLGIDAGSSSIKVSLVNAETKKAVRTIQYPDREMDIIARHDGWAEQHPEIWWDCTKNAIQKVLKETSIDPKDIKSIGISYQMHGLVLVDENLHVLRPSIIWCDSRAVQIGQEAYESIGKDKCNAHLLNSPANFTASKLKWVKDNEPETYSKIYKVLLPGDYLAMKLSGEVHTTVSGVSEGIFWDFKNHNFSHDILDYFGFDDHMFPELKCTFSIQSSVNNEAADQTGLKKGTPISYRAGDQPNNAMSLGVFQPGQVAATGGTSGVVYGVLDKFSYDPLNRINSFAHVNHSKENPSIGLLLCINGAGILYAWMRQQIAREGIHYNDMERMLSSIPVGADGLRIIPFGNGSERMLNNQSTGSQVNNLQFNRHTQAHLFRAALEGIAFSFVYGVRVLNELGLDTTVIKAGNDNLFQSKVFSTTIANLLNCNIEIQDTTGAIGAAIGSGVGSGVYNTLEEAFTERTAEHIYFCENPNGVYSQAYQIWENDLKKLITHIN